MASYPSSPRNRPEETPGGAGRALEELLATDARKILISTIHKFGEAAGVLNDRANIIVLVDEAHRTQEGDLGRNNNFVRSR